MPHEKEDLLSPDPPHIRSMAKYQILRRAGASFRTRLDGEQVAIATVGQAYRFITSLSTVEWMEFQSLHGNAKPALKVAAQNAKAHSYELRTQCGRFRARKASLTGM